MKFAVQQFVFLFVFVLLLIFLIVFVLPINGGFATGEDPNFVALLSKGLFVSIPLYLGIFFGQMFKGLYRLPEGDVSLRKVWSAVRSSRSAFGAVFISPIVVLGLLNSDQSDVESIKSIALAFESGFFIDQLISVVSERVNPPPSSGRDPGSSG